MNLSARRLFFSSFSFWIVLVGIGLYYLLPLRESLRFGIDLVGGTYITLEVQTDKAVESELANKMQGLLRTLKTSKKIKPSNSVVENSAIAMTFDNAGERNDAAIVIKEKERELEHLVDGNTLKLNLPERRVQRIKEDAVSRNIEVLRTRLDKMSVAEITIAAQGERNIIVELPDVSDPQQAKAMIGKAAVLEFKLVDQVGRTEEDILYELDGELPGDMEILPGREENGEASEYYLVQKYSDITGDLLKDARPNIDNQTSQVVVSFEFTPEGGEKFYNLTKANIKKRLAVVLDGVIITAPTIQSAIRTSGQISGQRSMAEAKELSLLLKSGSFVAPVTFEEERQIGPSLGAESIRKGLLSCLVGLGLLLLFSFFYYSWSGFLAFMALVYNLLLVLLGLAWLKATLTLPGIAGMVLTIGMAIDASVLIYERIKEELAAGLTVKKAVNVGFSDAMVVILDANITTFIVGVVLYKFGTGPIQGFAVTMMLGILATLVTGLFFLRSLFNVVLDIFSVQKLKI